MDLYTTLNNGFQLLQQHGDSEAELDARLLLEAASGLSRTEIFLYPRRELDAAVDRLYQSYLQRRCQGEPVAYILGKREFWSLPFFVSPAVLIPRPETEYLLDRVLALSDACNFQNHRILDLCCGSGVIATVLARETQKKVLGCDISKAALDVASQNIALHTAPGQVQLVQADLLSSFRIQRQFSLIVSNPPYVTQKEIAEDIDYEVKGFEPHLALDGGEDGLIIITRICRLLPMLMQPGGQFFMEFGASQGQAIYDMFCHAENALTKRRAYAEVQILKDYAGKDRVLSCRVC